MVEEKMDGNQKEQAFHIISYTATQIHTHTYFVTLHEEKNDWKRALAKNHYESCCSDKQTP